MAKVTRILLSAASMQALVDLDNGDRHAFRIADVELSTAEIKNDAATGALAAYLDLFEGDTAEEIKDTEDQATDWTEIYAAA